MAPKRGYHRLESLGWENGSSKDDHRMVLRNFSPPSIIMCHHSIGAVAYVGRSVLLKVKSVQCTKRTPRILLDSDEYPECVETTPSVFGTVTVACWCTAISSYLARIEYDSYVRSKVLDPLRRHSTACCDIVSFVLVGYQYSNSVCGPATLSAVIFCIRIIIIVVVVVQLHANDTLGGLSSPPELSVPRALQLLVTVTAREHKLGNSRSSYVLSGISQ
jgi:hypothetical protein